MLYHPRYVAYPKEPTRDSLKLSFRKHPFTLDNAVIREIEDMTLESLKGRKFNVEKFNPLFVYGTLASNASNLFSPDEPRSFVGSRTTQQTWDEKTGHCWELGFLFYQLTSCIHYSMTKDIENKDFVYDSAPKIFVAKNLKGFELGDTTSDYGSHMTIAYRSPFDGDDSNAIITDLVSGRSVYVYPGIFLGAQRYYEHEAIALHWIASAEDKSDRGMTGEALADIDIARRIDPNNYYVDVIEATIYENAGYVSSGIESYQNAMRIAPNSFDVHAEFCEFLYRTEQPKSRITREIGSMLGKETTDYQVVDKCQHLADVLEDNSLKARLRQKKKALIHNVAGVREWIRKRDIDNRFTFRFN